MSTLGGSHPEVFCKESILKNFARFIGKHLCQGLFFDKVAGFNLQIYFKLQLYKKEALVQVVFL